MKYLSASLFSLAILALLSRPILAAFAPTPYQPPGDLVWHNPAPEIARADRFIARWQEDAATRREIIRETWAATGDMDRFYLLLAQQAAESKFEPTATNGHDFGLAQINHRNLAAWGITDWRSIRQSVGAQARFMGELLSRGGTRQALVHYNAGWRRVVPRSTVAYVVRVLGYYRELAR